MRLICPNCGAQYEVTDDVIPEDGRDVQCSNCGHTWFEGRGASQAAEAEADAQLAASAQVQPTPEPDRSVEPEPVAEPEPETEPETLETAAPETEPELEHEPDTSSDPEQTDRPRNEDIVSNRSYAGSISDAFEDVDPPKTDDITASVTTDFDDDEPPLVTTPPPRRAVDASIADILRQEAERETAARRRESDGGLETQGELGLPDAPKTQNKLALSISDTSAPQTDKSSTAAAVAATIAAASRKELLPDIEEINSSLRSSAERGEATILDPEELAEEERRGFRFGFFSILMLIIALTLIYVFAPHIAERVPLLTGILQGYVNLVDAGRLWLDIKMQELLVKMRPV